MSYYKKRKRECLKIETNLEKIKNVAIIFLYQEIETTEFPFIVLHPFFSSPFQYINGKMINILDDPLALSQIREEIEEWIRNAKDVEKVFYLIRKPYHLTFLKYIKKDLSDEDFSRLLGHIWVTSENPNQDVNVPINTLISWFRETDKQFLMTKDDFKIYENLPEEIFVYRGVSRGRNPDGLSWTRTLEKAKWFANRFGEGYVRSGIICKQDVLAYFSTRGEEEIVLDVSKIKETPF